VFWWMSSILRGFTTSGWMTSVNCTLSGTTSTIREKSVAQVVKNRLWLLAKLKWTNVSFKVVAKLLM